MLIYSQDRSSLEVIRQWNDDGDESEPPAHKTICNTVSRFRKRDSVDDYERTGRPITALTEEDLVKFVASVEINTTG